MQNNRITESSETNYQRGKGHMFPSNAEGYGAQVHLHKKGNAARAAGGITNGAVNGITGDATGDVAGCTTDDTATIPGRRRSSS